MIFKAIVLILLTCWINISTAQNLTVELLSGASYGINKFVHTNGFHPGFHQIPAINGPSFGLKLLYNFKGNASMELSMLNMANAAGVRVKKGGRTRTTVTGNANNSYALGYLHRFNILSKKPRFITLGAGIGFENIVERFVFLGDLHYAFYENYVLSPFIYTNFKYSWQRNRHTWSIELRGHIGLMYNTFYWYRTNDLGPETYEAVMKIKGDMVALMVSYGFQVIKRKYKEK